MSHTFTDYEYQSRVSFIADKTEQLTDWIKSCKANLENCEHRAEMTEQFRQTLADEILELVNALEEINTDVTLDLSESAKKLADMQ